MLERTIKEFKRIVLTDGIFSSLNFLYWFLDDYFSSQLAQRLVYNRMNGYVVKKLNNSNVRMILNTNDQGISQELIRKGSHEPLSTKILMENLHEGMRIVDVGANLGYFALQEAKAVESKGRVYAIEPVPQNYFLLKQNTILNNLQNMKVFNLAIGDKDESLSLFLGKASNWASAFRTPINTERKITVPSMRLDTFLKNREKVDLIRMDVEGYEAKIVDGMEKTLKQKNLMLFMEIHPIFMGKKRCKELLRKLTNHGFTPFAVVFGNHPGKEIKSITSMKSLMRNDFLMKGIFHGFFRN
jgi:FkbM family methyltransferase